MDYIISQIPLLATLCAALIVCVLMVRIYQPEPYTVTMKSSKRDLMIAVLLYIMLFMLVMLIFWGRGTDTATAIEPAQNEYTLVHAFTQLLINIVIFLPFGIIMRIRKQDLQSIGISTRNFSLSIIIGFISCVFAIIFFDQLSLEFWLSASTVFIFIAQIGVGLSEEAIFRGYLLRHFSIHYTRYLAELLTALMFALIHIPQRIFYKTTFIELVVDLVVLFIWGWVFNVIMRRTGNIAGLALLHTVINVVGV